MNQSLNQHLNQNLVNKINEIRKDFPILNQKINGKNLIYLDNAATTQKPIQVLGAVDEFYRKSNANANRGTYTLSTKSTEYYNKARENVQKFINARFFEEIIFTSGATEAINLVAYSYGMNFIEKGDEIAISIAEHHSNLVPWQQVCRAKNAKLVYLYTDENGEIPISEIESKINSRTKLVCIAHVSNVLGKAFPVEHIVKTAHENDALVLLDMAQSVPHMSVDVEALDIDFAVFSGHKMLAPMGIGVLYGKKNLLEKMPPFLFGGDMIEIVRENESTFAPLPKKFEAGTRNIGGAIGLSAAIDYINTIGFNTIHQIETELVNHALNLLSENENIKILGGKSPQNRTGVISFMVDDVHPHDVATILDADGICIRAGHHCANPLMKHYNLNSTCRASLYFYNTFDEIEQFANSLKNVRRWLYGVK